MGIETVILLIALVAGFYMAWSVGANDVANAMGTSVGSGALTIKRAVILAAILEFIGAVFVGTHVSETIRKGIISPEIFIGNEFHLIYGMIGALIAAAVWLQVASYFGWPVSTTHSIVGSVLGFGVMYAGTHAADWGKVASIVASWIISPLLCGTLAYLIFSLLRRLIFHNQEPVQAAKKITPYVSFCVFWVLTLAMVFKGLKNLHLHLEFGRASLIATAVGLAAAAISFFLVRRIQPQDDREDRVTVRQPPPVIQEITEAAHHLEKAVVDARGAFKEQIATLYQDLVLLSKEAEEGTTVERGSAEFRAVERIFVYLQVLSAAFVAFAHGANDVANAVGPLAAVISILQTGQVAMKTAVPLWVLVLGGTGIVIGLATWGWRVMITVGKKITELTPTRGFSAEFAAASTIVLASKLGLPVSTTHTLVGGVLGVGLARGLSALNLRVVTHIIISWIVTLPAGALGAMLFYHLMRILFG